MDELSDETTWLRPSTASPLQGNEPFVGLDATVCDFWRWAFSDLRDNTTRGILAEYLVRQAVGDTRPMRIGWDNFDVLAPDGTTVEVKASAYLQGWSQRSLSKLSFGRVRGRAFDADRNEFGVEPEVRADVFVFAVQTQIDPMLYDMLDINHWRFWVVTSGAVRDHAGKSVGMKWVEDHAAFGSISWDQLAEAIQQSRQDR